VSNLSETQARQTAPPFALHFDRNNVLKFFIYLTDTDESNGAMRALPGSNLRNRATRLEALKTTFVRDIANVVPEPETPSLPITGVAGTMFVFDTDVCHGASTVAAGRFRRTMRGHTHAVAPGESSTPTVIAEHA
jgi:ectoine hydroxylase-related dioxygenase (phytanoyl-CoA dioxygenase family)